MSGGGFVSPFCFALAWARTRVGMRTRTEIVRQIETIRRMPIFMGTPFWQANYFASIARPRAAGCPRRPARASRRLSRVARYVSYLLKHRGLTRTSHGNRNHTSGEIGFTVWRWHGG